ncbi:KAT8 regulatory NSL complex subunit 3 [Daktulosphaira vitifoliae]|uniref:KAT8 regulatory NSL complex subunit 3 n=1 Tax=Daktulosphaira vitifoliae TaxID=58002 RepID=UPI0021AA2B79|nr:KAT8 regulatory NSL complex subunit 3 [Daktulosphaira vitifoliae]XP_050543025.1 KAT8 regulatory NSL complex subunit 3 [Daktulosphaira vitifoliae]
MEIDPDPELKSDFTSYLEHISQRKKRPKNVALIEHNYSSTEYHQDNLCSTIKTLFIHNKFLQNENVSDEIDVEIIDNEVKLLTYRPEIESKSMEPYRNNKIPRDPEAWEDTINKLRWTKMQRNLFERTMNILYANRLSRLTFEETAQEDVQKIISTEKSVAEMHHLLTNYTYWDPSLTQWLHGIFISHLPDDYLASYIDILEKLKQIVPTFINDMISTNTQGRSKEDIKYKPIHLDEPVDPFNYMLTTYPPLKLPKDPVIILVPEFPGYLVQPNTRSHDWMNALSYLAELVVALTAKVPWDYEDYSRQEEIDIETGLDAMVDATRSKIVSLRAEDPNRPIILAGVGVSAAIACQVAVLEKVEGIVCIGFIVNSSEVKRGYEGDCILGLEYPTVFITGQLSIFSPVLDLEELRVKLKCKTSHILVGGADDDLIVNHSTKMREAITQKLVDRCILEEVGNFLKEVLEPMPKIIRKPEVEKNNFKKPLLSKRKLYSRGHKGNQKLLLKINDQSSKKNTFNRKINIPCTSLKTNILEHMTKDEELMPPPSSTGIQDHCFNSENSIVDSNQTEMSIPKLGNQKFSTLAELLQEQTNSNINVSQTNESLESSLNGSPLLITQDSKGIMVCNSNFQLQQIQPTTVMEITADQILDMPIVFADESLDEAKTAVSKENSLVETSSNNQKMIVKEEPMDDDEDLEVMCSSPTSRTAAIPERLNIKQVAYDSPSKVKLVVNKAPRTLVPSGYQTFSVPSQKSGSIQFVNRLSPMPSKVRKIESNATSKIAPKTVSIRHIQDGKLKVVKTNSGQHVQINKMKTMATTQKFRKIL